ncbi:MAG TPA: hypothetical protein VF723_16355 [Pyrinomonadaceae bacterium]|jgi:hypothetical protein
MKAARALMLLACCLLLCACPPEGGSLSPLAEGEGVEILTTNAANDTLGIRREGLSIKARGLWSVADSATSVILEISNANTEPVTVDFNRCELVQGEGGERLSLRAVSDEQAAGGPAFLTERTVTIDGGRERRFALEFKINPAGRASGVRRDVLGQRVTLRMPVSKAGDAQARTDFVLTFKYAEGRQGL